MFFPHIKSWVLALTAFPSSACSPIGNEKMILQRIRKKGVSSSYNFDKRQSDQSIQKLIGFAWPIAVIWLVELC
jgi:hypothetical protein